MLSLKNKLVPFQQASHDPSKSLAVELIFNELPEETFQRSLQSAN